MHYWSRGSTFSSTAIVIFPVYSHHSGCHGGSAPIVVPPRFRCVCVCVCVCGCTHRQGMMPVSYTTCFPLALSLTPNYACQNHLSLVRLLFNNLIAPWVQSLSGLVRGLGDQGYARGDVKGVFFPSFCTSKGEREEIKLLEVVEGFAIAIAIAIAIALFFLFHLLCI